MRLSSAEKAFNKQLYANSLTRRDSIVPLFAAYGKRLRLVGSATYLRIHDRLFLATAAHIPERWSSLITRFPNDSFRSIESSSYHAFGEWADVAICELRNELPSFRPIAPAVMRKYDSLQKGMPLAALGYPETRTRIYGSTIDCTLLSVVSREEVDAGYAEAQASKPFQIAVHFRGKMKDADGSTIRTPRANGMSGGG